jgi:hypothetical protein
VVKGLGSKAWGQRLGFREQNPGGVRCIGGKRVRFRVSSVGLGLSVHGLGCMAVWLGFSV